MFVIGPDKKIKLILIYPMTAGRNFDEVLRVIDSLQLTANHKVATPAQWQQGDDVIIAGTVSDDEARETYPDGWESPSSVHPDRAAAGQVSGDDTRRSEGASGRPLSFPPVAARCAMICTRMTGAGTRTHRSAAHG